MNDFKHHPLQPGEGLPLFISAGVIKEPSKLAPFMGIEDPLSAPVVTLGGYTISAWPGNAKPGQTDFVYYEEQAMAGNARGLPNDGTEAIRALAEPVKRLNELGIKTIIQITNLPRENPKDVIRPLAYEAAQLQPTAIEVNLSCPNGLAEDGSLHPPICNNPEISSVIMADARAELGDDVTLGAKDSSHTSSPNENVDEAAITALAEAISPHIDFIVGINTIGNQPFPELICAGGRGGMSGPVIAKVANQHLKAWRQAAPGLAYLSCGGVDSANAGTEIPRRLEAGAILVGGAQEFYRARNPLDVVAAWALKWAAA